MTELDDELSSWDKIKEECDWSGLLLGNGFSQNIWSKFGYQSLFQTAAAVAGAHLDASDIKLFERLRTKNFELVLSALSTTKLISEALELNLDEISRREISIKQALIQAVHSVHVPWARVEENILNHISTELSKYSNIYCTNYDLLSYWSIMRQPGNFRDYFWAGEGFDISNTEVWGKKTILHYIHGGLHLYRRPTGQTLKRRADENGNLLDAFGTPYKEAVPLFISEGTANEKLSSIYRSDYLSFVFSQLVADDSPIVVFGSSLSAPDKHIVDAIGKHKGRSVAVSIRKSENIRKRKAEIIAAIPDVDVKFFDAETHPLGRKELSIPIDG